MTIPGSVQDVFVPLYLTQIRVVALKAVEFGQWEVAVMAFLGNIRLSHLSLKRSYHRGLRAAGGVLTAPGMGSAQPAEEPPGPQQPPVRPLIGDIQQKVRGTGDLACIATPR